MVSAGNASVVLATLATAMLTFLGVVFSIGLVALQLASQQFSPQRVLRNYVRSTTTKVALGTFIATFIYPLFSLAYLDELVRGGRSVSTISVAVAMVLALASIAVFIAYVTLTIRGMRIAYAISTVAVETRTALNYMFPAAEHYVAGQRPTLSRSVRLVYCRKGPWSLAEHAPQGVLQAVDVVACVRQAHEHDVVLRLVPQVGDYVSEGEPLFEVFAAGDVRHRWSQRQAAPARRRCRTRARRLPGPVLWDTGPGRRGRAGALASRQRADHRRPSPRPAPGLPGSHGLTPLAKRSVCRRDRCGEAHHGSPHMGTVR